MSNFLSNLEYCHLLECQRRALAMPDGSSRSIDIPRLYWNWYERLLQRRGRHFFEKLFDGRLQAMAQAAGTTHDQELMKILESVVRKELSDGNDPFETSLERFERRKAIRRIRDRVQSKT